MLLYILLIIIAFGILNLSQEGKGLLNGLSWLAFWAGVLFIGFWVIVIIIAFSTTYFSTSGGQDVLRAVFGYTGLYIGYLIYKRVKEKKPVFTRGIVIAGLICIVGFAYMLSIYKPITEVSSQTSQSQGATETAQQFFGGSTQPPTVQTSQPAQPPQQEQKAETMQQFFGGGTSQPQSSQGAQNQGATLQQSSADGPSASPWPTSYNATIVESYSSGVWSANYYVTFDNQTYVANSTQYVLVGFEKYPISDIHPWGEMYMSFSCADEYKATYTVTNASSIYSYNTPWMQGGINGIDLSNNESNEISFTCVKN